MDLYDAFGLQSGSIVAAVGGGGKTSLVYALAGEAARRGESAIITTSTKFTRPPGERLPPVVIADESGAIERARKELRPGVAFVLASGRGPRNRLLGYEDRVFASLALLQPGLISIEADGSAHRTFKAPADHEPAIPPCATDVVVCVGLDVLGKPLDDRHVHRPRTVAALAETAVGEPVTVETIVRVLRHPAGGRKGVPPGARLHALLNNPRTDDQERLGAHLASRLVYEGFHRAVVATAHSPGDVRALVT
jgi:molybdenum cofactor cytidylyltransferase